MHHEVGGWLYFGITVVMVIILAAALIYGTMMWRTWRKHPTHEKERDEAVKKAYREDA